MFLNGPSLALFSAVLFGVSPILAKLIIGSMSPILLAGLLYLGSGIGLQFVLFFQRQNTLRSLQKLSQNQKLKLAGAILCGGIVAPLCLTFGIQSGSAFEVSLLLNLEAVATTLIAWMIFHEHVSSKVWLGKVLLVIGAGLITMQANNGIIFSKSALLILGACFFWGIDNNLTRDVEDLPPMILASVKGFVAGSFNTILAISMGQAVVDSKQTIISLLTGCLCYGASLVLFVKALRKIGSARTSTYFAAAPFFGMLSALLLLREQPSAYQWAAAIMMATGLWVLYGERHGHAHQHQAMNHSHVHTHDEHHQHSHLGTEGRGPHDHEHKHEPLTHTHVHWPDTHHRHKH